MSSANNKPVLSYSEFLAEKIDQDLNLTALKVKGKAPSKEVDPEMEKLPKSTGKKISKEVDPKIASLPKGGKASKKEVSSNLSNLDLSKGGKASKANIDPKFAKMPSAVKNSKK